MIHVARGNLLSWLQRLRSKANQNPAVSKSEPKSGDRPSESPAASVVISKNSVSGQSGEGMDYLSTPSVAAYFDARECEAYYEALKRAGPRRDFHERLVGTLERFIELTGSSSGAAAVDRVISESLRVGQSGRGHVGATPLEVAHAKYPEGIELLRLGEPLTYESLRSAYRSAALRNHPDAGGSHEAMVQVNEAFQFVHILLREREMGGEGVDLEEDENSVASEVTDCAAYRYKCGEMLFLTALDDWNVDRAFLWLEHITSAKWQQSRYASYSWRWLALTEPTGKLATRLSLSGLSKQASRALAIARRGLEEAEKQGLNFEMYVREPEEVMAGERRAQVVLNHKRQADNALRLGLIDASQYRKTIERLKQSAANDRVYEEDLRHFLAGRGFLQDLPVDHVARGKTPKSQLVPEPGYYLTRISQLTDDQQGEYLIAFSDHTTLSLVRKYTFVRFMSLLESVLLNPGFLDEVAAEQETQLLAAIQGGSGRNYGSKVADVIALLREVPLSDRQARARLIAEISQGRGAAVPGAGVTLTVTIGDGSPLGMPLTADYFKAILLPVDKLRTMQQTGRLPESDEDRREREAWLRESEVFRRPDYTAAQQRAFGAMDIAKENPEAAIEVFSGHCEYLLNLGRSMVHVQELQVGYWVDRLTGALVRLKRWREAQHWLQRYFALPQQYRGRSSQSEEDRLEKRLARCAKMLHGNNR